ncbi:rhodopsin-like GPCR transmembrane domain-containing protein [Phthorimaea operculella]|nr:rhodopsin-like GPCR transmembrane domain-containing protein [Phthorimaea operculella]
MFPVVIFVVASILTRSQAKWVEGRVDTKENWAFLSRFCFLSIDGQFEYLIEFDPDMGTPNLLLYYDEDSQWPAVYHSSKSCKEKEAVLNKHGQNQIIKLSHWYPDTEISGCVLTKAQKELPASVSSTTTSTPKPSTKSTSTTKPKTKNTTKIESPEPSFYDQFLKTTNGPPKPTNAPSKTTITDNVTTWYEVFPTDFENATDLPVDELWENIGPDKAEHSLVNETRTGHLEDVELMFDSNSTKRHKIKRSTDLYERFRRRRLKSESEMSAKSGKTERFIVSCHNSRRFRSARERWWFIAISNCDSNKGLDVRYKFLMTNGPDGDFWHEHFSADEAYVLPVLLAYTFAYVVVMIAVVMCSVELKSRHLLHSTYKLFLISIVAQHFGVVLQSLAYIKYASNGVGADNAKIVGQFFCGFAEMTFLLLLVLLAKGYTVTRGRLKVGFTVKLTVFMCCYVVTYIVLFVYQAKAFDPGEVLYLYESPAGYGLIVLRVLAWCVFAYSTFFTVKKYPEKNMFYCPFFICGTLWFHAGALFILTANNYIDKWVRESVVTAVLLFITFSGHIMFLLLTLPVFANKNFPYHVRTTQIGVMEVTGAASLDRFGPNAYHPSHGGVPQTVIIPLTRRTEELIGNMYTQYMATAPPMSLENGIPKLNGTLKNKPLLPQDSTETNNSDDINPHLKDDKQIFTVEGQMNSIEKQNTETSGVKSVLPHDRNIQEVSPNNEPKSIPDSDTSLPTESLPSSLNGSRGELPSILRSRRTILEPIKRDEVPSWSLAKGPSVVAMQKKKSVEDQSSNGTLLNGHLPSPTNIPTVTETLPMGNIPLATFPAVPATLAIPLKKVPPVRNGLQASSGEISTIHEGHIQSYKGNVSKATIDLFSANSTKG